MQAFFYGRPDGTAGEVTADLVRAYVAKMGSYKAFGPG
jgi:peptidoglycan hydrolase-like protein with peptidoglycan-binding domain